MASMIIKGRDGRHVYTHARYHQRLLTVAETKFVRAEPTLFFVNWRGRMSEGYVSTLGLNLALL